MYSGVFIIAIQAWVQGHGRPRCRARYQRRIPDLISGEDEEYYAAGMDEGEEVGMG
jgi:hypothetical protein